ncbi:MAG: hypothetical protein R2762_18305 [Bryobacteraceae bacterium]
MEKFTRISKMECEYSYDSDRQCFGNDDARCKFEIKRDTAVEYRIHIHNISWKDMPFRYEVKAAKRKNADGSTYDLTTEELKDIHPFKEKSRDGLAPARLSPHHKVSNNMGLGGERGGFVEGLIYPIAACSHEVDARYHTEWHIEC